MTDFSTHLRGSVSLLTSLSLTQASKWAAEALNGLGTRTFHSSPDPLSTIPSSERDLLSLARAYFECKEFDRCAHALRHCTDPHLQFLRLYAQYLSGDKKREEESEGILGTNDANVGNVSVPSVLKELGTLCDACDNAFLLYLYGVLLLKQKSINAGVKVLIRSLREFPYNWSCWSELITSLTSLDQAYSIIRELEQSFDESSMVMLRIAKVVINQEFFQQSQELHDEIDSLIIMFPNFHFLKTQKALVSYHALEYQEAETTFDTIIAQDPYCLDDMDTYSNILYVMEKRAKLSFLTQLAQSIDRFRPETCCIIANYYSLKFEHEKAIMYYRRALTLNRQCLSAWTLMGHEFVECKNSHAAIESYRRAVDTNPKDFKAWYGLGQAYEVLDMHVYSLYYYQQAAMLKPHDKRIWIALGECYTKLNKLKESVKSYKRALQLVEFVDLSILLKLAQLYESMGEFDKVAEHMRLIHAEEVNMGAKGDETARARLWLARYEMRRGAYQQAYAYAVDLAYGTSQEIEDARAITREASSRMKQ